MSTVGITGLGSSTRPPKREGARAVSPAQSSASDGRCERNKQQKRERIKAAARKLFSTKGFAATTTQEIAEEADIGTGTLFLYVQSKEEVLVLVFRDEMDRVCDEAFAALPPKATLLEQLNSVYGVLIRFHERDPGLARVFVKEVMFVGERLRQSIAEFVDALERRWVAKIEEAKQRGELLGDVPAAALAENCFAAYLLLLQKWLGLGGPLATSAHIARLRLSFELQLRGLAAPKTLRRPRAGAAKAPGTGPGRSRKQANTGGTARAKR
jgi:AcrR family transcriptional regulator